MRSSVFRRLPAAVLAAMLLTGSAGAVAPGDKAPDFTLPAAGREQPVKLADLLGKGPVVVYTFIQAFTPA
ncbi:MAG TPA: redoxin domain-containing protein [Candidatus Binatia bacterium]|nr:redoxin domain-containing protein [Candidatus Binatia bacterium]